MNVRKSLKYISAETNNVALAARGIPESEYDALCDALAAKLDTIFSVTGTRVFMVNPDSGLNEFTWPVVHKSSNVVTTAEDPATRIELFSQIQTKSDWLCKKQTNGQAYRPSSTTGVDTLYSTSSILDQNTGLTRYVLKSAVPLK